jgi:hypothetical protein
MKARKEERRTNEISVEPDDGSRPTVEAEDLVGDVDSYKRAGVMSNYEVGGANWTRAR